MAGLTGMTRITGITGMTEMTRMGFQGNRQNNKGGGRGFSKFVGIKSKITIAPHRPSTQITNTQIITERKLGELFTLSC